MASLPTSLDPLETSEHPDGLKATAAQRQLHAAHWAVRTQIIFALQGSECPRLEKRAFRIDQCCFAPILRKDAHGNASLDLQTCRDRLCPKCQHARGRKASAKISQTVCGWSSCRFVTLTLKAADQPLAETLARLAGCFRLLRRHPDWKSRVTKGVWSIEVVRNVISQHWHVHLHCLTEGAYFEQKLLSKIWKTVTGDSDIVDIRAVSDRDKTAKYIAAYISKPAEVFMWTDDEICEYADALHGRRLIHTFGAAHGQNLDPTPEPEALAGNDYVGPLENITRAAELGCPDAAHASEILRRLGRSFCEASGQPHKLSLAPAVKVEPWEHELLIACTARLHVLRCSSLPLFSEAPPAPPKRERQSKLFALVTDTLHGLPQPA